MSSGKSGVVHLQRAQLANQGRILREAEARLDRSQQCVMDVEYVALCTAEIRGAG